MFLKQLEIIASEIIPKSLSERTKFKLGCNAKNDKIKLEPIPDPDMYLFFEKGTRARISYIPNRCTKTNNI